MRSSALIRRPKVLDFCGRRVIGRNFLSIKVHFYRETGITRQLSKSQALKVYSLKTAGIEGSGNGARNFLIEGEYFTSPVGLRAPHTRPSIFTRRLKFDF